MLSPQFVANIDEQGARIQGNRDLRWRVWAPRHETVELLVWPQGERRKIAMRRLADGFFEHRQENPGDWSEGLRYAYRLPGIDRDLPDPASSWQPDGVHHPSAVFDPGAFSWTDGAWTGVRRDELSIYELHVGTFTTEGTLDSAIARLPDLAELGVTAVELMPIAQFPGTRNWGYDGVHPNAVQNSYGGPRALQRFVDAAHRLCLGVVLDVVYNHFGPEGSYFGLFGPYFTARYHTPWGQAINYDGPDCEPVRQFVIDSACRWIREFHIDGLRLDAVQTIYDLGASHILAELSDAVHATGAACRRSVVVTAETDQNDVRLVRPLEQGGYDLDAVWNDDFHHALHAVLTKETHGYYEDFGEVELVVKTFNSVFAYDGNYSRHKRRRHGSAVGDRPREQFIVCTQNHDQIGNRAYGERLGELVSPAAQRLAAALLLISPYTPLVFMGEEYGETRRFPFFCSFLDAGLVDAVRIGRRQEFAAFVQRAGGELPDPYGAPTFESAKLAWQTAEGTPAAGLRNLYRTLLRARRQWAPLRDRRRTFARLADDAPSLLVVERGREPAAVIFANLSDRSLAWTPPDDLRPLLSTAESKFGGERTPLAGIRELHPFEVLLTGGPECPSLPN